MCKVRFLLQREPSNIAVRCFNVVTKIPYSDCFNPEEHWLIASTDPSCKRCVVRMCFYVNFHGSSFMSGLIRSKATSAGMDAFKKWEEWAKQKLV